MHYEYEPKGVCCKKMMLELSAGQRIKQVAFEGGCKGWSQAVANLIQGKSITMVIGLLLCIKCGNRETSCPDQLAKMCMEIKSGVLQPISGQVPSNN